MKIGIASFNAPWDFRGGLEVHSWELAKALSSIGNEVHFYFSSSKSNDIIYRKNELYLHQIKVPYWGKLKPNWRRLGLPIFNYLVQQKIKRNNLDIFHSQNFDGLPFIPKYNLSVVTIHTTPRDRYLKSKNWPNRIATCLEHYKCKLYSNKVNYIAISEKVQEDLDEFYSTKSEVISNGVNIPEKVSKEKAKEKLGISDFGKTILFFSRVTKEKGPHKLLNIIEENEDIGLLICGKGDFINELKDIIKEKKVQSKVRILGYVNPNDMKYVFSAADCFALPSEQAEGQPITILEAISYGLPCYVTNLQWVPSYLRNYAISGDLKTGVLKALDMDKKNIYVMTWLDVAQKTQEIYKKILL